MLKSFMVQTAIIPLSKIKYSSDFKWQVIPKSLSYSVKKEFPIWVQYVSCTLEVLEASTIFNLHNAILLLSSGTTKKIIFFYRF